MLKYIFVLLTLVHGLIHFMGFAKAFGYGNITQLTKDISKPAGVFWFITALLLSAVPVLYLLRKESWPLLALLAAAISQVLIFTVWKDAKFGSIANLVIALLSIAAWGSQRFESQFRKDVKLHLQRTAHIKTDLLTVDDLQHLPAPVQKYLHYAGVVNQPKLKNMRIVFHGEMRNKGKDWFKFNSIQYNFFDEPTRLFFMKAKMFGTTVPGYHDYQNATARMNVKLFGIFPVAEHEGVEMNKAEAVTVFNDMCLMAPAALIDKRIQWEPIDSLSAKAIFSNAASKISAILYFNEAGQLINFISDDRYAVSDMKQYRFSTPAKEYKKVNGKNVLSYGEAVWHYPEGEFLYGKFYLKSIEYNVDNFKE